MHRNLSEMLNTESIIGSTLIALLMHFILFARRLTKNLGSKSKADDVFEFMNLDWKWEGPWVHRHFIVNCLPL